MTEEKQQLISRKRHYLYVLVFSVAIWLFVAEVVAAFWPLFIGWGLDEHGYPTRYNIGPLIYGLAGIIFSVLFSLPLHRWMIVAFSKQDDKYVPVSRLARYGKALLGWRGLILILVIYIIYSIGNFYAHGGLLSRLYR